MGAIGRVSLGWPPLGLSGVVKKAQELAAVCVAPRPANPHLCPAARQFPPHWPCMVGRLCSGPIMPVRSTATMRANDPGCAGPTLSSLTGQVSCGLHQVRKQGPFLPLPFGAPRRAAKGTPLRRPPDRAAQPLRIQAQQAARVNPLIRLIFCASSVSLGRRGRISLPELFP